MTKKQIGMHWKIKDTSKMGHPSWLKGTKGIAKSNSGSFKKGQEAWNFEGKGKLKRKFVKRYGKFMLNAHYVFCAYHQIDCIPKGYVIHHRDGNSLNDSIDNLVMMTYKAHKEFHNKLAKNKFIAGDKLTGSEEKK